MIEQSLYNFAWLIVYHLLLVVSVNFYVKRKIESLKWDLIIQIGNEIGKVYDYLGKIDVSRYDLKIENAIRERLKNYVDR